MSNLSKIFPNSAGIDIGSEKVYVAVENQPVRNFRTFTSCYRDLGVYLKELKITHVAMEATGIYWVNLTLSQGLHFILVSGMLLHCSDLNTGISQPAIHHMQLAGSLLKVFSAKTIPCLRKISHSVSATIHNSLSSHFQTICSCLMATGILPNRPWLTSSRRAVLMTTLTGRSPSAKAIPA